MEFLKIKHLKHSGIGKTATHIQVMDAFKKSVQTGIDHCTAKGMKVEITDCLISIKQNVMYGFEFVALIKN